MTYPDIESVVDRRVDMDAHVRVVHELVKEQVLSKSKEDNLKLKWETDK